MVQLYNMKRNTQGLLRPGLRVGTVTRLCPTLLWPCGLYNPWNSPGQNTGVGNLSLLQEIFPTQGSNPGLLQGGGGGFFTSWATREAHHWKIAIRAHMLSAYSSGQKWSHDNPLASRGQMAPWEERWHQEPAWRRRAGRNIQSPGKRQVA